MFKDAVPVFLHIRRQLLGQYSSWRGRITQLTAQQRLALDTAQPGQHGLQQLALIRNGRSEVEVRGGNPLCGAVLRQRVAGSVLHCQAFAHRPARQHG